MNGASADPSANTSTRASKSMKTTIGVNHHFFLTLMYSMSSEKRDMPMCLKRFVWPGLWAPFFNRLPIGGSALINPKLKKVFAHQSEHQSEREKYEIESEGENYSRHDP
jgi:hypothetical protein